MAQKIIRTDDLDDTIESDVQTMTFSLEGVQYEVDLGEKNREAFAKAVSPYQEVARTVGRVAATRPRSTSTSASRPSRAAGGAPDYDVQEVRTWARANDLKVNDRGRISQKVLSAFREAKG